MRRCSSGNFDGGRDEGSRKALELFNKNARTSFDIMITSIDALDAVRGKTNRVCPLECPKGRRVDGDHCTQIGCSSGYILSRRDSRLPGGARMDQVQLASEVFRSVRSNS
jgi:hypothetical protein